MTRVLVLDPTAAPPDIDADEIDFDALAGMVRSMMPSQGI